MENVKFLSSGGISLHLSLDFFIKTSYLNGWMVGKFVKLSILLSVESFCFFFRRCRSFREGWAGYPSCFAAKAMKLAGVWMCCTNILQNNEKMPDIPVAGSGDGRVQVLPDSELRLRRKFPKNSKVKFNGNSKN